MRYTSMLTLIWLALISVLQSLFSAWKYFQYMAIFIFSVVLPVLTERRRYCYTENTITDD